MIDFKRITLEDMELHRKYMSGEEERGCEYSFANLYLWGRQTMAEVDGCLVFFSQFSRRSVYPFPVGNGDKKAAVDALRGVSHAVSQVLPRRTEHGLRPHTETFSASIPTGIPTITYI